MYSTEMTMWVVKASTRIRNAWIPFLPCFRLYLLVAALVALTTMTRMVDEERLIIGTYKALGGWQF